MWGCIVAFVGLVIDNSEATGREFRLDRSIRGPRLAYPLLKVPHGND